MVGSAMKPSNQALVGLLVLIAGVLLATLVEAFRHQPSMLGVIGALLALVVALFSMAWVGNRNRQHRGL